MKGSLANKDISELEEKPRYKGKNVSVLENLQRTKIGIPRSWRLEGFAYVIRYRFLTDLSRSNRSFDNVERSFKDVKAKFLHKYEEAE